MGNTYYCNYYNPNTGQNDSYQCPCDLCWQSYNPNTQNPCPPCSNTTSNAGGLAWYYWLIIAVGILFVLSLIAGVVAGIRKRKKRQILLVQLQNSQRRVATMQVAPKVEYNNVINNQSNMNQNVRNQPPIQPKPVQKPQNLQNKVQTPQNKPPIPRNDTQMTK